MRLFAVAGVLAVFVACSPAASGERTVVLDIEHSTFSETRLEFQRGEKVRFVVNNNDPIDHELIIGDEEVQDIHEEGTERHHAGEEGEVSVPGGESRATTYTFAEKGTLIFGCHLPGHYDYGMRGEIEVQG